MEFPEPGYQEALLSLRLKEGQGKMRSFSKLIEEDPTFSSHTDEETGQTIIEGMGELHLEIIVDRLLRELR